MLLKETLIFALFITSIDIVWLKTVMGPMYRNWFSSIGISMPVHVLSAVVAYFLMISAYPLLIRDASSSWKTRVVRAGIVGLLVYGIYGFTVSAVFPKYGVWKALLETVWGVTVYTVCTVLTFIVSQKLL